MVHRTTAFAKLISPKHYSAWISRYQNIVLIACIACLAYGLIVGLFIAPADFQQGNVYRIMYVHVPLAIQSLSVYCVMTVCALIFLVWKIKIADFIAKISAPIGALFTILTLFTGAIWGEPTWGTYWIWDARLTSELILVFIYVAIIAMRYAIADARLASFAAAIVTLLGAINIPIVHYSVIWWNTLHQGPSILQFGAPTIAPAMLHPLIVMIVGFFLYYLFLVMIDLQVELK